MWRRFAWGVLLFGVAFGCSDGDELSDGGLNGGAAGSSSGGGGAHAGAATAGVSGSSVAGEGGAGDVDTPGGAGGDLAVGGETSQGGEGGEGGVASVHFFTDATQHVDIGCFGFFAGAARFRADRAQLSPEQLDTLSDATAAPGDHYDGNDDQVHCIVTTTDADQRQREFVDPGLVDYVPPADDGGAPNADAPFQPVLLGCEFHVDASENLLSGTPDPRKANPLCVRELSPDGKVSTFSFELAKADTPYHLELIDCAEQTSDQLKVELYGADSTTPLAVGAAPADPGPNHVCLVLDAQVPAPVVGHLVFTSASAQYDATFWAIFR